MDHEKEELKKNINLAVNCIDISTLEFVIDLSSSVERVKLNDLFQKIKLVSSAHEQKDVLDEVSMRLFKGRHIKAEKNN